LSSESIKYFDLTMRGIRGPQDSLALSIEHESVRRDLREERVDETAVTILEPREQIAIKGLVLVPADGAHSTQVLARTIDALFVQARSINTLHQLHVDGRVFGREFLQDLYEAFV
jgi:hypothetical protein